MLRVDKGASVDEIDSARKSYGQFHHCCVCTFASVSTLLRYCLLAMWKWHRGRCGMCSVLSKNTIKKYSVTNQLHFWICKPLRITVTYLLAARTTFIHCRWNAKHFLVSVNKLHVKENRFRGESLMAIVAAEHVW